MLQPNGKAKTEPEPLTLGTLFDIYGEEVTATKTRHSRMHDRTTTKMFLGFLGRDRDPATLSQRDWDHFIRERRAGRIGPSGRPVSDRTIEHDLKFLIAVLNWAERSRDEQGRVLLDRAGWIGGSASRSCSPTKPGTALERFASFGGATSTSRAGPSGGEPSLRRRATSTSRR